MARDHQVLIGRHHPHRHGRASPRYERTASRISFFVQCNSDPTGLPAYPRTYLGGILSDASGKDEGIETLECCDERAQLAANPIDEQRDRLPRGRRVARQQGAHIAGQARNPEQAGTLVDQMLDGIGIHPLVRNEIQNNAGVESAGPGSHRQTIDRRKSHGGRDAAAVRDGAHAGAVAEMRDHEARRNRIAKPVQDRLVSSTAETGANPQPARSTKTAEAVAPTGGVAAVTPAK